MNRVRTMIDTGRLTAALDRLVAAGITEAAAPPVDAAMNGHVATSR